LSFNLISFHSALNHSTLSTLALSLFCTHTRATSVPLHLLFPLSGMLSPSCLHGLFISYSNVTSLVGLLWPLYPKFIPPPPFFHVPTALCRSALARRVLYSLLFAFASQFQPGALTFGQLPQFYLQLSLFSQILDSSVQLPPRHLYWMPTCISQLSGPHEAYIS